MARRKAQKAWMSVNIATVRQEDQQGFAAEVR